MQEEPPALDDYTPEEMRDEKLRADKEMHFIKGMDIQYAKVEEVEAAHTMNIKTKSQFLNKLNRFKHQGKINTQLNKIGNWIDRNKEQLYVNDPLKSDQENFYLWSLKAEKLFKIAEHRVLKRQEYITGKNYATLTQTIHNKKTTYVDKIHYIDQAIEKDILYFKPNYDKTKKDIYDIKKKVNNAYIK